MRQATETHRALMGADATQHTPLQTLMTCAADRLRTTSWPEALMDQPILVEPS